MMIVKPRKEYATSSVDLEFLLLAAKASRELDDHAVLTAKIGATPIDLRIVDQQGAVHRSSRAPSGGASDGARPLRVRARGSSILEVCPASTTPQLPGPASTGSVRPAFGRLAE
jgi:hypothetical protein